MHEMKVTAQANAPGCWDDWQARSAYPSVFQSAHWAAFQLQQSGRAITPQFYSASDPREGTTIAAALVLREGDAAFCWEGPCRVGPDGDDGVVAILTTLARTCANANVYLPLAEDVGEISGWIQRRPVYYVRMIDLLEPPGIWDGMKPAGSRTITSRIGWSLQTLYHRRRMA